MFARKIVTAALVAVGVFVSIEYESVAQSQRPSTEQSPTMTQQTQTELSSSDKQFITQAAQGGMAEVQLGELARKRASSKDVRNYAARMVQEHTKANKQLMALATKKGVTPPKSIGPKNEALRARLSKLSGTSFDREYMKEAGVIAHTEQEALYRRQSTEGQDPQLKAFAAQILPTVQKHLQMAESMTGSTSPSASPSPSPSATTSPLPEITPSR